jgi:hypothetical protein
MKRVFSIIFAASLLSVAAAAANSPDPARTAGKNEKKTSTDQRIARARRQVIEDLRSRGSNIPAAFSGSAESRR